MVPLIEVRALAQRDRHKMIPSPGQRQGWVVLEAKYTQDPTGALAFVHFPPTIRVQLWGWVLYCVSINQPLLRESQHEHKQVVSPEWVTVPKL